MEQRADGQGRLFITQRAENTDAVTVSDKIAHTGPVQRLQGRRDVISYARSRDYSGSKIKYFLDARQVTCSGPAPDREAVEDMWENMRLD